MPLMELKRPMRARRPGVHREITSVASVLSHVATGDTSVPKDPSIPRTQVYPWTQVYPRTQGPIIAMARVIYSISYSAKSNRTLLTLHFSEIKEQHPTSGFSAK